MSTNLLETVRAKLGYASLHQVDPNLQEVKELASLTGSEKLAQSALPATLTAFSSFIKSETGYDAFLNDTDFADNVDDLFKGEYDSVVARIGKYSGASNGEVEESMEKIAQEAMISTREAVGENPTMERMIDYINAQQNTILQYLPASLQIGKLFNDNSLDDRTHKMQGPFSSLAHMIEDKLSGGETPK